MSSIHAKFVTIIHFAILVIEQPPVKYNSKLMNSIWGQYNRYSVHNIKQIAGDACTARQQLPGANDL